MKRISLKDTMTGETLDIEFDLDANIMRINGEIVIRKREFESDDNQRVYGPPFPGATKLYHLTRVETEQMRKLWKEK
jgi:hypothetical protein